MSIESITNSQLWDRWAWGCDPLVLARWLCFCKYNCFAPTCKCDQWEPATLINLNLQEWPPYECDQSLSRIFECDRSSRQALSIIICIYDHLVPCLRVWSLNVCLKLLSSEARRLTNSRKGGLNKGEHHACWDQKNSCRKACVSPLSWNVEIMKTPCPVRIHGVIVLTRDEGIATNSNKAGYGGLAWLRLEGAFFNAQRACYVIACTKQPKRVVWCQRDLCMSCLVVGCVPLAWSLVAINMRMQDFDDVHWPQAPCIGPCTRSRILHGNCPFQDCSG